jgi:hypothetical protein
MKQTTEPFEELPIPRRELQNPSTVLYRVYRDYKNYELVEAVSALDALSHSKIKNIYKIERHNPLGDNVIQLNQVIGALGGDDRENISPENRPQTEEAAKIAALPEQSVAEKAVEMSPPPAAQESAPLSNDDIDKLLNS